MSIWLLLFVIGLVIFLLLQHAFSKPPNFPPGPPRLPIWGGYWFVLARNYKFTHLALDALGRHYKTNILGLFLGPLPTVVTLDYKTTHEMLSRVEFSSRVDNVVARMRGSGKQLGIFFTEGDYWTEQRRFSFRYLRDFGLSRRCAVLESVIESELKQLISLITDGPKNEYDKTICKKNLLKVPDALRFFNLNIFWVILTGETFPAERREEISKTIDKVYKFQRNGEPIGGALIYTPWLQHVWPHLSGYEPLKESHFAFIDFLVSEFKNHKGNYSEDHFRGFIDVYLKEMKERDSEEYSSFSEDQLLLAMADCTFPSIIAVAAVLSFTFWHVARNREIQKKIHKEIDTVVGQGRFPTLDDRILMPYTEATVREGLRHDTLNPMGIFRRCDEDTTLNGYFIPKGTLMLPGAWSSHMDADFWGDPTNFRPERFLDADGKLLKKDNIIAFGAGKRVCMGETFSRNSLFLFMSTILQNFTIGAPEGSSLPELTMEHVVTGGNMEPIPYWIQAIPRN